MNFNKRDKLWACQKPEIIEDVSKATVKILNEQNDSTSPLRFHVSKIL